MMEKDEIKELHSEYKSIKKYIEAHGDLGMCADIENITLQFMRIRSLKKIESELASLWRPLDSISQDTKLL